MLSKSPALPISSSNEEIAIAVVTCAAGVLGLLIGVLQCRVLEAGLGALMTFFGTWALANALRG